MFNCSYCTAWSTQCTGSRQAPWCFNGSCTERTEKDWPKDSRITILPVTGDRHINSLFSELILRKKKDITAMHYLTEISTFLCRYTSWKKSQHLAKFWGENTDSRKKSYENGENYKMRSFITHMLLQNIITVIKRRESDGQNL